VIAQQDLDLDPGESATVTFEDIDTSTLDPGEYEHGVFSEDDSATGTLTVEERAEPAEFTVSNLDPQDVTVTQGDLITVSAAIENVGGEMGTQTIEFRVDGTVLADQDLDLDAGESVTVGFEDVDTADLDPGEYEHGIFSEDGSATGSLMVEEDDNREPTELLITEMSPQEVTVTEGDSFDLSVTVENVGEESGTGFIEVRVPGIGTLDTREVDLDSGESETITFQDINTAGFQPDEYDLVVLSPHDEMTGTLTIEEADEQSAEFTVTGVPELLGITQGETFDVPATVENAGEESGTQTVEVRVDGTVLADQDLTLDVGASQSVTFTDVPSTGLDPGEYEYGVFSEDDSATGTLSVNEPAGEPVEFLIAEMSPQEVTVTEGDSFDLSVTVENAGEESGTGFIEVRVPGVGTLDTQEVTLDSGESQTVTFSGINTAGFQPDEYDLVVLTPHDEMVGTLVIEEGDGEDGESR